MSIISNTKQSLGNFFLQRDQKKVTRNRLITSLSDVKTVGLLFDASIEEDHVVITEFVKYFQESQKVVKALGYVNFNRVPHYCYPKLSYDYFTNKDMNWYLKPVGTKINDFVEEEFDLMIDLCLKGCFSVRYIAALSKAKFKVGRFGEKNKENYDFMLDVAPDISLKDFIQELTHYLTIINK